MTNFIEKIAPHGPQLILTLSDIISGPKDFIKKVKLDHAKAMERALTFNAVCLSAAFLIELPFIDKAKDVFSVFGTLSVLFIAAAFVFSITYKLSFTILGGRASLKKHMLINLYISGPVYLFGVLMSAASKGIVMANNPTLLPLLKDYMNKARTITEDSPEKFFPLYESTHGLIAVAMVNVQQIAILVWVITCWGAYRYINNVSRTKSTLAFFLALIISWPFSYVMTSAQSALGLTNY